MSTTPERPAKPAQPIKPITVLTVTSKEQLTPSVVRIRFSGDLASFEGSAFTDRYVKLVMDGAAGVAELEAGGRPTLRTYTVTELDVAAGTLTIDFVIHGDEGVAGPWAAGAEPGDTIPVRGPGGAYAPNPAADWHLFAGDEAAIPAIRQALAALPDDAQGHVVLEVDGPSYEQEVAMPDGIELTWLHRTAEVPVSLVETVRSLPWREGRVDVFVHGEGEAVMRGIRPYLFKERSVPPADVSISAYWKKGRTEERFREWKSQVAQEEQA